MILSFLNKQREIGLLILRVGMGVMFILHGWPKIQGGPANWTELGHSMSHLGVTFAPVFWGFMAALAEFGGGICLVLGFAARPVALIMAFNMLVASLVVYKPAEGILSAAHPIEAGIVFLGLVFLGAGKYSIDGK